MNNGGKHAGQWFSFTASKFSQTLAHGGEKEITVARVLERAEGPLRFIDLSIVEPGADIGLHTHELDNEELYIVLSGRGWMTLDDRSFEIGPGDVVLNRPGGAHGLKNTGDEPLRLVVIEVEAHRDAIGGTR